MLSAYFTLTLLFLSSKVSTVCSDFRKLATAVKRSLSTNCNSYHVLNCTTMLSTCFTSTKTVLVLLIAAATLQLGVASPIVRREIFIVNLSPSETNLRDGLFVADFMVDNFLNFNIACASIISL